MSRGCTKFVDTHRKAMGIIMVTLGIAMAKYPKPDQSELMYSVPTQRKKEAPVTGEVDKESALTNQHQLPETIYGRLTKTATMGQTRWELETLETPRKRHLIISENSSQLEQCRYAELKGNWRNVEGLMIFKVNEISYCNSHHPHPCYKEIATLVHCKSDEVEACIYQDVKSGFIHAVLYHREKMRSELPSISFGAIRGNNLPDSNVNLDQNTGEITMFLHVPASHWVGSNARHTRYHFYYNVKSYEIRAKLESKARGWFQPWEVDFSHHGICAPIPIYNRSRESIESK
ncbi:MAG: hypothetical protein NZ480_05020 [Bdellovibrionaceae bacterium]|nr:hypothetical protein [Pseudobdellovibrionaceae bacterium]MDW8191041.1 hypothetical protein [Pseudobdellovibrionaceae bacterium]